MIHINAKQHNQDLRFKWYRKSIHSIPDKFKLQYVQANANRCNQETIFECYKECEKIGLIPGLIFPDIVRPYSLKTPTYLISLENDIIFSHFFLWTVIVLVHESLFIYLVKLFKLINHIKYTG